jgi:hypothetical protein
MRQLREEDGVESDHDDESKWEGWDVETDSSETSDDEGWMDVDPDSDKDIVVSDSDDEGDKDKGPALEVQTSQAPQPSTLGTTKVKISSPHFDALLIGPLDPDTSRLRLAKRATYPGGNESCAINRWQQSQTQTRGIGGFTKSPQY